MVNKIIFGILVFLLIVFIGCNKDKKLKNQKYNGINNLEFFESSDSIQEMILSPYSNSKIKWLIRFYPNGEISRIFKLDSSGGMDGICVRFSKQGEIMDFGDVKKGRSVGKWYEFYGDGSVEVVNKSKLYNK